MPIEIRELIIKAAVNGEKQQDNANNIPNTTDSSEGKEAIIQQCVEIIMALLRKNKER